MVFSKWLLLFSACNFPFFLLLGSSFLELHSSLYSKIYGFSSSYVWMWEVDHKENWALKNWCFQIVVLEKALESLLDRKGIKSVNSKGNQPWIFIGRTGAKAEASIHWSPDANTLMLRNIEGKRKRLLGGGGGTEGEMVGWHHWLNGHEFEQTQWNSEGQGSLVCCSSWSYKESNMT